MPKPLYYNKLFIIIKYRHPREAKEPQKSQNLLRTCL